MLPLCLVLLFSLVSELINTWLMVMCAGDAKAHVFHLCLFNVCFTHLAFSLFHLAFTLSSGTLSIVVSKKKGGFVGRSPGPTDAYFSGPV